MSDSALPDWSRKYYSKGGGNPFLFYIVFGNVDVEAGLSQEKYLSNGLPANFDLMKYDRTQQPEVFDGILKGYLWNQVQTSNPSLAQQIAECDSCLLVRGEVEDPETLNYLRDTMGFLAYCLDHGGCAVYDPLMFGWWSKEEWMQRFFLPEEALLLNHVMMFHSDEQGGKSKWYHSRGLRKFGRPDLSVKGVPPVHEEAVQELFNRFIEFQAVGGVIDEGQEIHMEPLPSGAKVYHRGHFDDPDFNNVHVAIEWPDGLSE